MAAAAVKLVEIANGAVVLFLWTAQPSTDEVFDESLRQMAWWDMDHAGDLSGLSVLVITDGGAPSTLMRRKRQEWLRGRSLVISVVTDSAVARGVATATRWFNAESKVFPVPEWKGAFAHARVLEPEIPRLLGELAELEKSLDAPSVALGLIRRSRGDDPAWGSGRPS